MRQRRRPSMARAMRARCLIRWPLSSDVRKSQRASALPPVALTANADPDDRDNQVLIDDLVQNPIVALADSKLVVTAEFFSACRPRILSERADLRHDPLPVLWRHALQFLRSRLREEDVIACHASSCRGRRIRRTREVPSPAHGMPRDRRRLQLSCAGLPYSPVLKCSQLACASAALQQSRRTRQS